MLYVVGREGHTSNPILYTFKNIPYFFYRVLNAELNDGMDDNDIIKIDPKRHFLFPGYFFIEIHVF